MAEVSHLSDEDVWLLARSEHPVNGAIDLRPLAVEAAFVGSGDPATGDWKAATWETGTKTEGGLIYYLARVAVGPTQLVVLANDVDYLAHVRVTSGARKAVLRCGVIHAY